jgi:branched-chain amino acid transport system ATP-binding protein
MSRPPLFVDEPPGLAPLVTREIFRIVRHQQRRAPGAAGQQNAAMALGLADHAYLLETGRVVMSGPAAELRKDDSIRRSYLGY